MRLRLLPASSPVGWTPYGWLIYLSFFVFSAMQVNEDWADWTRDGVVLAAFLVMYFRAFWVREGAILNYAMAIVALGVVTAPYNMGASAFFIYGAAFLGDATPRPAHAIRWLALIVVVAGVEAWLVPLRPETWIPAIVFSLVIGGSNIHFAEMRRKNSALIKAHKTAEQLAAVAERERIARDLHDVLGHTLSVIVIKSELASKLSSVDPARAAAEIRDVERISRHALQEVRHAIDGYRGERVADEISKARVALDAAGVTVTTDASPVALDVDAERALALALREAVTNVVRHARAARCEITLANDIDGVRLIVQDDGVGGTHVDGAGLSGMRARLGTVAGALTCDGTRGTRLTIFVPHAAPDARTLAAS